MFSRYFHNYNEVKWVDDNLLNEPFDDEDITRYSFGHQYYSYNDIILMPDVTVLPIKLEFKNKGNFSCAGTQLQSLENCPQKVSAFLCNDCTELESLEFCPFDVEYFDCTGCIKLKSLKHMPLYFANSKSIITKIIENQEKEGRVEIKEEIKEFKKLFENHYFNCKSNRDHFKINYYDQPEITIHDYIKKFDNKIKTNRYF